MWETVDPGEMGQQVARISAARNFGARRLRRLASLLNFGFEPLALPWHFPVLIGQKRKVH
jgi:hypothetical protein